MIVNLITKLLFLFFVLAGIQKSHSNNLELVSHSLISDELVVEVSKSKIVITNNKHSIFDADSIRIIDANGDTVYHSFKKHHKANKIIIANDLKPGEYTISFDYNHKGIISKKFRVPEKNIIP
ncbi:MAG: hypothetical protein HRT68_01705 [Flavobacteriaceae bacterium]|nr:hypothetical protein [Flavobacteriaceae bacterium]